MVHCLNSGRDTAQMHKGNALVMQDADGIDGAKLREGIEDGLFIQLWINVPEPHVA